LYLLCVFQLAFSNAAHRRDVYAKMPNWREQPKPASIDEFDWRTFQQQYRDYIDLAKLAQLVPVIGAPVGAVVNYRLLRKLGDTAINAYRMRWFDEDRTGNAPLSEASKPPALPPAGPPASSDVS
jgi:hypothetical protein